MRSFFARLIASARVVPDRRGDRRRAAASSRRSGPPWSALLALLLAGSSGAGCATAFPTFSTPERPVSEAAGPLDPPPPDDLFYLRLDSAKIPKRTRDGRAWDTVGGETPDPFAILFIDDREVLRTAPQPNTLEPRWRDAPGGNFRVGRRSVLRIEMFDHNPGPDQPICMVEFARIDEDVGAGRRDLLCDNGATVRLHVEPARAVVGVGITLEVHFGEVIVTRVVPESPADRAGLRAGSRIVAIQGKRVRDMVEGEARSMIYANLRTGFTLSVLEGDGTTRTVELENGPIYPVTEPGSRQP
jgi:membrane-associated protease RseP (regulator of RpoE activity)